MATKCIDISDNKKMGTTSPIAMFVFVGIYVFLTLIWDPDLIYLIVLALSFVFTQIFFQYKPRYIFLSIKFLFKHHILSPSFDDKSYLYDETVIPEIAQVLHPQEIKRKQELSAMNNYRSSSKAKNYNSRKGSV